MRSPYAPPADTAPLPRPVSRRRADGPHQTAPASEPVGRGRAVSVADRYVGMTVEAVADPAHGADDVLVPAELGPQTTHVNVDRALARRLLLGGGVPQRPDELRPLDGAALA